MAQPEKRENSVLFSLRELRQIEENRVQEEEQAVRSAEQARLHAQQQEERRRRDEEEAKVNAERAAALAIEQARENAEREVRMRVESTEAAERARQQAALEQQRLQQEMELRRAEVAKKRPTWMLAVTFTAIIGVIVAIVLIINAKSSEEKANEEKTQAQIDKDKAIKAAEEAQKKVDELTRDLADQDRKVQVAVDDVVKAQSDADRATAKANLDRLRQEKADYERRLAEARAAAERAKRLKGATINEECKNNPLAKGCM